jgi:catechol 2,3-dioxygenase-like lactoylglutathione lyase family enzyme
MPHARLNTGPGSIELKRSSAPLVRADKLLFVHFERPDLAKAERYLADFGLVVADRTQTELFMRGAGTTPYVYRATLAWRPRFAGLGFSIPTVEDLQRLAKAARRPVETSDAPGGGSLVRLTDPDGVAVHVLHGQTLSQALPQRAAIPHNAPDSTIRVNDTQRPPREPPQVTKLGHLVIETPDFDKSARWYMHTLGFIPSDVMCLPDGAPVGP